MIFLQNREIISLFLFYNKNSYNPSIKNINKILLDM